MTTETIIWRPQRTRVFTVGYDNPWSRSGDQVRSARAFLEGIGLDRQEEVEDWEVVARPRPTRRHHEIVDDVVQSWAWFDVELADDLVYQADYPSNSAEAAMAGVELAPETPDLAERRRAQAQARVERMERVAKRRAAKAKPWRITLERDRNYALLMEVDRCLVRSQGGHTHYAGYLGPLRLTDTNGFVRSVTPKQAVFILERGDLDKETKMYKICTIAGCLAPEHYDVE